MKELLSWIAQNPTLQALAIVVTLATAAYYAFKTVFAVVRFTKDAVTKGINVAQANRARRAATKQKEFVESAQDTTIFIGYLAEKSALAALFVVMAIIANISLTASEGPDFRVQMITKALAMGIAAYRLGLVTAFVRRVREIRKGMLWPDGGQKT
jgi:hypothetical protein